MRERVSQARSPFLGESGEPAPVRVKAITQVVHVLRLVAALQRCAFMMMKSEIDATRKRTLFVAPEIIEPSISTF